MNPGYPSFVFPSRPVGFTRSFDGFSKKPIKESGRTNPLNNYGLTKLNGDLACLKNDPKSIILRTSWVYSSYGHNFVKTMIELMSKKNQLMLYVINLDLQLMRKI